MCSSILVFATNCITITDEDVSSTRSSQCSEESNTTVYDEFNKAPSCESLLSVLDDKNKMITILKKQIQNQKIQLSYYIKKELNTRKIEELSETCTLQASEESLPLNLALNKFCRQTGIKTKLSQLHERMNRLDCKISSSLRDQEFVLRKIVNKLCEFVRLQGAAVENEFKVHFGSFITDPLHVNLFNKLLTCTVSLRSKLDSFKICCDRVLIVEEERNAIVEQVYSMPTEQRMNCNYLLEIQMEKAELENEVKRISQHQAASRHRVEELNVIEKILCNLQWELNSSFLKNEESCISKMLKKINSEARVLLEMTKEQKRRFECELSKTKYPDMDRILLYIKMSSECDMLDKKELEESGIKAEEEIRLYEAIKMEIDNIKKRSKQKSAEEMMFKEKECQVLQNKLSVVLSENTKLKVIASGLERDLDELKLKRQNGLQRLKEERDAYKSQVEDLQAIREAYAQLVDKQPNTSKMEREFLQQIDEKDRNIFDLESDISELMQEVATYKTKLREQNDQIVVLNRFINISQNSKSKTEKLDIKKQFPASKLKVKKSKSASKENTVSTETENAITKEVMNITPQLRSNSIATKKFTKELTAPSGVVQSNKNKSYSRSSNQNKNAKNLLSETFTLPDGESLTCFKIYSQKNGKTSDIVKAMVTTSAEVEGNIMLDNSSTFSIDFNYKNNEREGNGESEVDEFELYKDCSRELVFQECRPRKISRTLEYNYYEIVYADNK